MMSSLTEKFFSCKFTARLLQLCRKHIACRRELQKFATSRELLANCKCSLLQICCKLGVCGKFAANKLIAASLQQCTRYIIQLQISQYSYISSQVPHMACAGKSCSESAQVLIQPITQNAHHTDLCPVFSQITMLPVRPPITEKVHSHNMMYA